MEYGERLGRAREATGAAGLDALLITPGPDLRYLTGYAAVGLERLTCLVLPAAGDPALVVPRLERPAALASPAGGLDLEVLDWAETEDPYGLVARLLPDGAARVAVDDQMHAAKVFALRDALPGVAQSLAGAVTAPLRMRKSPAEVAALRRAGEAIDRVHARMGEWLRPGRTEREVGRDVARAILAEGHAGDEWVVVGSGPNGASPHHEVSDRVIEAGDPVVVDIGGTTPEGYCSDSTRTYLAGGVPDPELAAYHQVVEAAQEAAVRAVRPGVPAEAVDAAAREVIAAAGYGEAFLHRTGHGIGLETHEEPYVVAGNGQPLEPGMAFSVEPGIYLAGRHGVRIEDIVVVTSDGVERLNRRPRALTVL
ncbi:MAG TPA: Xaa-Pro peptidase family protein [Mycobacteriales bacterium]|nr:Xaa-Pro peptidase family protein [Mycobacteriales bacterium]